MLVVWFPAQATLRLTSTVRLIIGMLGYSGNLTLHYDITPWVLSGVAARFTLDTLD